MREPLKTTDVLILLGSFVASAAIVIWFLYKAGQAVPALLHPGARPPSPAPPPGEYYEQQKTKEL